MATEKKLSPEQAAINAALVLQYAAPAKIIGRKAEAIDKAKGDTWSAFKDAARIGWEAGQTADTMAKGISLACAEFSVPQGTVNAYLPILRKLYKAVAEEGMQRREALALSIKEARAKWQPKPEKKKAQPSPAAAGGNSGEGSSEGTTNDENGIMGETPRSRLLSKINAILATLSDDDLAAALDMLTPEHAPEEQREAA